MGNREDLLEGAKRCLYERGYARTTARDIVAASGTNLASIGYHYGSKEALLDAALMAAIEELSELLAKLGTDEKHLPEAWDRVMAEFDAQRPLLIAHAEASADPPREAHDSWCASSGRSASGNPIVTSRAGRRA